MRTIDPAASALLVVDVQARLMPAIPGADAIVANLRCLLAVAAMLDVPAMVTEQNPGGLGPTVPGLAAGVPVLHKMAFDACRDGGLVRLPDRPALVVGGCETHVCVLQTVLGLLEAGRRVYVVQDAVGSRRVETREAALRRMAAHGAEVVTAEMVAFEWLGTAEHPRFRDALALLK